MLRGGKGEGFGWLRWERSGRVMVWICDCWLMFGKTEVEQNVCWIVLLSRPRKVLGLLHVRLFRSCRRLQV